ncbi:hypothetical protein [Selenomonas ruminantium]|uniref:Uncharacterized protein n=1 Tax=Selenomonas ruminantium TaxID=971 RepID=A0A1H3ZWU3_SELRU|nr:hypothetical protein [Selenomonas ruminantium]SEA28177.1 hypothetical protein SAMN05660648_02618 [Selenomonas ruminantium]
MDEKFTAGRVAMIKAGFLARYSSRLKFIENSITTELIELLLRKDRLENILRFCASGHAPLKAVVDEIEVFAEKNNLVVNGRLPDEWKQDVGRLIGTIVYFFGYESDGDSIADKEDLQKVPTYFHYAAKFHKR